MKKGIDISFYQMDIDAAVMAGRGIEIVCVRSSYGKRKDVKFVENWRKLTGHVSRSFYHYFLSGESIKDQVDTIKSQLGGDMGDTFPWLDLEWREGTDGLINEPSAGTKYLNQVDTALKMIDDLTGMRTAIYTGYPHVTTYLPRPSVGTSDYYKWCALGERPLVIAHYATNALLRLSAPTIPLPWFDYTGWQFSSKNNRMAKFFGCEGNDLDLVLWNEGFKSTPLPPLPPIPPTPPKVMWKVVVSKLNVRAAPSPSADDIGDLFLGNVVEELAKSISGNDIWILHEGGWSAAVYSGTTMMKIVE